MSCIWSVNRNVLRFYTAICFSILQLTDFPILTTTALFIILWLLKRCL